MTFGSEPNKISETMRERGVSVHELARMTGLSLSCIRRLRQCGTSGSIYTWKLIADALGVAVDELIGEEREQE